jgi:hypothetical protein
MSSATIFLCCLLEFGAEVGVKAGYHEEPDEQSDVNGVIHRLLLSVVSNLDFEFYI